MEVPLTPEQQKAIAGLAAQNGTTPTDQVCLIIEDALNRQQDYERWFREQVREGRAAAERDEFVDHEDVGRMLDDRYRGCCVSAGHSRRLPTSPLSAITCKSMKAPPWPEPSHERYIARHSRFPNFR